MSWLTKDFNRETCLTCQHCKIGRRMKSIGRDYFIEYDSITGNCKLFNNYPTQINNKLTTTWCHYRRWVELPD